MALPLLLTGSGERPRAGLGELLGVTARAAVLAGAKGEVFGLAEMAAREGASIVLHEARRLHELPVGALGEARRERFGMTVPPHGAAHMAGRLGPLDQKLVRAAMVRGTRIDLDLRDAP